MPPSPDLTLGHPLALLDVVSRELAVGLESSFFTLLSIDLVGPINYGWREQPDAVTE